MTALRALILRALLALGLSFSLWAFVSFSQNPEELVPFEGLTPQVVGLAPNLIIVDANGSPSPTMPTVNVILRTDRNQRAELRPVDIRTVVDLSGFSAGEHTIPVNVQATRSSISFTLPDDGVTPEAVLIRLEEVITTTVQIDLKVVGNLPFSFERGEPQITSAGQVVSQVTISGPQNRVQRVSAVQTTANVEQLRASYQAPLSLMAVDANGQLVDGIQTNPTTVQVRIPITSVVGLKLVPVQAQINGLPKPGSIITSVQVDPPLIALTGSSGPLDTVAVLQTEVIDVTGADTDMVRQVPILFPSGTSPQVGEPNSVEVIIKIAQIDQTFQVDLPVQIRATGLTAGLLVGLSPNIITLTLTGQSSALAQLAQHALLATVDVTGLGPGTYELPLTINLPTGTQLVHALPNVTVLLQTSSAPPTELPTSTALPAEIAVPTPSPTVPTDPTPTGSPLPTATSVHETKP